MRSRPRHPALRDGWALIANPAVAGRNLNFHLYVGRPIAGSAEELKRLMESVTVDAVLDALRLAIC